MKKVIILLILIGCINKTEAQSSVFKVVDSLLLKGNYQQALKLLETDESNAQFLEKSANIYQTIGDFNKSISCYKRAIEINESEKLKVKLANTFNLSGNRREAIKLYQHILEKDSSNLLAANSLGKLYLRAAKAKKAEKIYRFLLNKDTINPNYSYQIGQAFKLQNKPFKMGQSYLDAFNKDTLHVKSIYELAKFFKKLKIRDSSNLFIEKGLNIDSLNVNFLQLKTNSLYFKKQFKDALKHLYLLDSLNYRTLHTYEMFGMSYVNLKQLDSAEVYFKKGLKIEQHNPKLLYRLAAISYERKNIRKAEIYLMQAIAMNKPEVDKHFMLLGIMAKEKNELKQAIRCFEEAYKNNYRNRNALFELAMACEKFYEDKKIALRHYEKFVERSFNSEDELIVYAKERIKLIRKQYFIDGEIVD